MLRRVLVPLGLVLLLALAGCGGAPRFQPAPGKVRISPIPAGHGQVNFPANVTVGGTGLFIFTHGVRQIDDRFQLNVGVIVDPVPGTTPGDTSAQAWLGQGDAMTVDGLTIRMLAVYNGQYEGDVQVTASR